MIEIKELHDFDGGLSCYYAKGDHHLFEFFEALERYGAFDCWNDSYPIEELIVWQWWRWVPDTSGFFNILQYHANLIPSPGAFQVTAFWRYPVDGHLSSRRWKIERELNRMAEQGIDL